MFLEIEPHQVKLDRQGRLVIPREIREALKLEEGAELIVHTLDGELRITTVREVRKRAFMYPAPAPTLAERLRRNEVVRK